MTVAVLKQHFHFFIENAAILIRSLKRCLRLHLSFFINVDCIFPCYYYLFSCLLLFSHADDGHTMLPQLFKFLLLSKNCPHFGGVANEAFSYHLETLKKKIFEKNPKFLTNLESNRYSNSWQHWLYQIVPCPKQSGTNT